MLKFNFLLLYCLFLVGVQAKAFVWISHYEKISAETVFSEAPLSYCIKSVNPNVSIELLENIQGIKSYECRVDFAAEHKGTTFSGARILRYYFQTQTDNHGHLQDQKQYQKSRASSDGITYEIPNVVFQNLDSSSTAKDAAKIEKLRTQITPDDKSLLLASRAACYLAFLDLLDNACDDTAQSTIKNNLLNQLKAKAQNLELDPTAEQSILQSLK